MNGIVIKWLLVLKLLIILISLMNCVLSVESSIDWHNIQVDSIPQQFEHGPDAILFLPDIYFKATYKFVNVELRQELQSKCFVMKIEKIPPDIQEKINSRMVYLNSTAHKLLFPNMVISNISLFYSEPDESTMRIYFVPLLDCEKKKNSVTYSRLFTFLYF